ncbi:MAG: DUF624 domain-containing protein [Oscillibacter sp.]|jgi:hypothetical protein|nr:DUF624 domain-containing protein [Oscillibacter sp.]
MFFRKDYAKPGPGVDRDEPEKTGAARLAEIFSIECVTLVKLNLLFLLSCFPVVTIPAAVFAMNRVTRMMVLDQPVTLVYHYKTAFRKEWKRAFAAFFAMAVPLILSACGVWFYLSRAMTRPVLLLPFMLCSTVLLLTLSASTYFYGLLTTERSFRECLRLSLLLGAGRPLRGALAALAVYGSLVFALLEFPVSGIYLLLMGFSVPCLLGGFFVRTELKRL